MEEKVLLNATLCYPIRGTQVLMGFKTKKIGKDRWNGYGGGIDGDETPIQSGIREMDEEVGLEAYERGMEKVAVIDFHNIKSDGEEFTCRVHIFLVKEWSGEPKETDEMLTPTWFEMDSLPENMMPSDKIWLPMVLQGEKIVGVVHMGPFQKEIIGEVDIREVEALP